MIEVGEWVRTKDGYIFKILTKENTNYGCCGITDSNNTKYTTYTYNKRSFNDIKNKIVKHSKNIIDLIEVGDLVNGYKVLAIADSIYENSKRILIYRDTRKEKWIYIQEYDGKLHTQDDIVEILTHEQYQANCYTVERKE